MLMATFIMTGYLRLGCFTEMALLLRTSYEPKRRKSLKVTEALFEKERIAGVNLRT